MSTLVTVATKEGSKTFELNGNGSVVSDTPRVIITDQPTYTNIDLPSPQSPAQDNLDCISTKLTDQSPLVIKPSNDTNPDFQSITVRRF